MSATVQVGDFVAVGQFLGMTPGVVSAVDDGTVTVNLFHPNSSFLDPLHPFKFRVKEHKTNVTSVFFVYRPPRVLGYRVRVLDHNAFVAKAGFPSREAVKAKVYVRADPVTRLEAMKTVRECRADGIAVKLVRVVSKKPRLETVEPVSKPDVHPEKTGNGVPVRVNGRVYGHVKLSESDTEESARNVVLSLFKELETDFILKKFSYVPGKVVEVVASPATRSTRTASTASRTV